MDKLNLFHYDSVDSTNRIARDYVLDGGTLPALFTADEQTAGRGRRGRSFYSPKDSGLYMTLSLPFNKTFSEGVGLTVAVSVALTRVLKPLTTKELSIKWVNDILADGKKVAGILCETVADLDGGKAILVGVGINLCTDVFPKEIAESTTSLGIMSVNKQLLAERISREIISITKSNNSNVIDEYREISAVLGQNIFYIKNGIRYDAKVLEIDDLGSLVVQNADGTMAILKSGEITLRIKPE